MNDILKQRLVGALILIALGVVFWPIIFVEPGDTTVREARQIPARPDVDTTPVRAPDKSGLRQSPPLRARADAKRREDAAESAVKPVPKASPESPSKSASKASKTRTVAPEKPVIDADGVPIAWILQVASVSKPEKAEALRTQLLKLGYKAYVKKVHRSGNVLLRVYIGPKFERAKLEKIKAGIDREFSVQSILVRYIP